MLHFSTIVPVLRVADIGRSMQWYHTILGFSTEPSPTEAPYDSCRLRRDNTELMLRRAVAGPVAKVPTHGDWDILLRLRGDALVSLLDEARRRTPLVRGPELMPNGDVEFELEDPDGFRVCVAEAVSDTRGIPRAIG